MLSLFAKIRQSMRNNSYQVFSPNNCFYSSQCQSPNKLHRRLFLKLLTQIQSFFCLICSFYNCHICYPLFTIERIHCRERKHNTGVYLKLRTKPFQVREAIEILLCARISYLIRTQNVTCFMPIKL